MTEGQKKKKNLQSDTKKIKHKFKIKKKRQNKKTIRPIHLRNQVLSFNLAPDFKISPEVAGNH